VDQIMERNGDKIGEMQAVYDLIITRDWISMEVMRLCGHGHKSHQLLDSVAFSMPATSPQEPSLAIITGRKIDEGSRDSLIKMLPWMFSEMKELTGLNPIFLLHDNRDLLFYHEKLPPEIASRAFCVNQPAELVGVYARCGHLISLRVHGSVMASTNCDARVVNVRMDSRSNILEYFGQPSIRYDEFFKGERSVRQLFDEFSIKQEKIISALTDDRLKFFELWNQLLK